MKLRTRFAPSPTGHLHVGNGYSALICQQWAEKNGAELLLRIEDIDHTRCRNEFVPDMLEDLRWLGFTWHGEVRHQSDYLTDYHEALVRLQQLGVIYPCFCSRSHIRAEIERMGLAPPTSDEADPYPGICRDMDSPRHRHRMQHEAFAWRLDMAAAARLIDKTLAWRDSQGHHHPVDPFSHGDVVIGRKDIGISYHLAVIVDDAIQGMTHVIRGKDLVASTGIHRLLQALLDLPDPVYIHHDLLHDEQGRKLAKRHGSPTLRQLRDMGADPGHLRDVLLGSSTGDIWSTEKFLGMGLA